MPQKVTSKGPFKIGDEVWWYSEMEGFHIFTFGGGRAHVRSSTGVMTWVPLVRLYHYPASEADRADFYRRQTEWRQTGKWPDK